jgi:hypothetical protein
VAAPSVNIAFIFAASRSHDDMMHDRITEKEVANPFNTLSAYITTFATICEKRNMH